MKQRRLSNETAGFLLGFIGVVIFGATLPMTRLAVAVFDPWFVTMGRAAGAGILAIFALALLRPPLPTRRQWPPLIAAALGLTVGFPGFMAIAMQSVHASHAGVVLGILPMATALAALLVGGERPSSLFWFWSLVGAAIVVVFSLRQGGGALAAGDLWLVAAGACAALGYAFSGGLARVMPGWAVISWALVIAMPASIAVTAATWDAGYLHASVSVWLAFAYLAAFSMFLGFFAWNAGMALGGVARVGQIQLLQTFVTLVIAALTLGERIDGETLFFAIAVVLAVAMGRRAPVGQRSPRKS